jgi:adenine deaminase
MVLAAEEINRLQGGFVLTGQGRVLGAVGLRVMGLMGLESFEEIYAELEKITQLAHEMGVNPKISPFMTLSFIALTVIPEIRLTPRGVFDVPGWKFL